MDLKANTAVDVLIGPFVDSTDGNTDETGLTISQADVRLSKNGQNMAQKSDATACVHDELGYYNCELDATDTNTEGNLVLVVHEAGALQVRHEYNVLSEAAWDSLYAAKDTGFMDVNIKAVSDDTTAADNLELACDNYSATRGLTGTAVPAVAADGAGGLPISDAGGLDLDTQLAETNEITAARMGALTDWINGGRLDLILDTIAVDTTTDIPALIATAQADLDIITGADGATLASAQGNYAPNVVVPASLAEFNARSLPSADYTVVADLGTVQSADNNIILANATYGNAAIRARGDAAWVTGVGSGLTALASGTAQSGTASTIVIDGASTFANDELNGNIINIHTGTGAGQSRVIISNTLADDTVNVSPNWITNPGADSEYEIVQGSTNTAAVSLTAQTANDNGADINAILVDTGEIGVAGAGLTNIDLPNQTMDIIGNLTGNLIGDVTGNVDGTVAGVTPEAAGVAPTAVENRAEMDSNSTQLAAIVADTNELQGDWTNGGRLDLILDIIAADTSTDIPALIAALQADLDTLTDAAGEPGDIAPPVSAPMVDKIAYLYKFLRNKIETTSTRIHVYDDAGTNKDHTSVISDDGTTFTRSEFEAGDA
jgi:hypothetical protein